MAQSDDDFLLIALLGVGAYLLYQYFKTYGFHFSTSGGAPGPLPFGGGGTPGGGTATGGSGGTGTTGTTAPAGNVPPSPVGAGAGTPVCMDANGNVVGTPDAAGNCPAGSTYTVVVNVTE